MVLPGRVWTEGETSDHSTGPLIEIAIRAGAVRLIGGQGPRSAQLHGIQIVRTSVFQTDREAIVEFIRQIPGDAMKPKLLADAGGSVDRARDILVEKYTSSTDTMVAMLQCGAKLGGILGLMRWQLVHFERPTLAYPDLPVVIWPLGLPQSQPFPRQKSGPLENLEIRVPWGPIWAAHQLDRPRG